MTVHFETEDVLAWAARYTGPKFHALLADPPYHMTSVTRRFGSPTAAPAQYGRDGAFARASAGFMGQQWDGGDIAFRPETWASLGAHLLPGAFGVAFASARGWHRLAVAIEDAGFVFHPSMFYLYLYGSGFPKATRIDTRLPEDQRETWAGHRYGLQALKPAVEPILIFQKPYEGRPLDNIAGSGAGALNIEATRVGPRWPANVALTHGPNCRIVGYQDAPPYTINRWSDAAHPFGGGAGNAYQTTRVNGGKVPVYHCEPDCPLAALSAQAPGAEHYFFQTDHLFETIDPFFYTAKASVRERNAGIPEAQRNAHPTLKPLGLTRYLASLLLPPAAYAPRSILVPFAGAGSEAIGAHLAGWESVCGVELSPAYAALAETRLAFWAGEAARLGTRDPAEILKASAKPAPEPPRKGWPGVQLPIPGLEGESA